MNTMTASAAGVGLNTAMLRFRRLQAEYDRTLVYPAGYFEAEDEFKAAYRRWEAVRGY